MPENLRNRWHLRNDYCAHLRQADRASLKRPGLEPAPFGATIRVSTSGRVLSRPGMWLTAQLPEGACGSAFDGHQGHAGSIGYLPLEQPENRPALSDSPLL